MQYAFLIYQGQTPLPNTPAWDELPADEQNKIYSDYAALNDNPAVTPGLPLGLPESAKTIRVQDGNTTTTDGPYLGAEAVGGYLVCEADDEATAIAIASTIPAARHGGAVEVRPVATYW